MDYGKSFSETLSPVFRDPHVAMRIWDAEREGAWLYLDLALECAFAITAASLVASRDSRSDYLVISDPVAGVFRPDSRALPNGQLAEINAPINWESRTHIFLPRGAIWAMTPNQHLVAEYERAANAFRAAPPPRCASLRSRMPEFRPPRLAFPADEWIYVASTREYAAQALFKIGRTTNLIARLSQYSTGRPPEDQFKYFFVHRCHDSHHLEYHISHLLGKYKHHNEMYRIPFRHLKCALEQICENYDLQYRLIESMSENLASDPRPGDVPPPIDERSIAGASRAKKEKSPPLPTASAPRRTAASITSSPPKKEKPKPARQAAAKPASMEEKKSLLIATIRDMGSLEWSRLRGTLGGRARQWKKAASALDLPIEWDK